MVVVWEILCLWRNYAVQWSFFLALAKQQILVLPCRIVASTARNFGSTSIQIRRCSGHYCSNSFVIVFSRRAYARIQNDDLVCIYDTYFAEP